MFDKKCFNCNQIIKDKIFLFCDKKYFHSKCLKCKECDKSPEINENFYSFNGFLFCFKDYKRIQSICKICQQLIEKNDFIIKARKQCIHFSCLWVIIDYN